MVEQLNIQANLDELNKLIEQIPKALEEKIQVHPHLNPNALVKLTDNDYEHYECLFCTQIIEKPVICGDCGKLVDATCWQINERIQSANGLPIKCPTCQSVAGYKV